VVTDGSRSPGSIATNRETASRGKESGVPAAAGKPRKNPLVNRVSDSAQGENRKSVNHALPEVKAAGWVLGCRTIVPPAGRPENGLPRCEIERTAQQRQVHRVPRRSVPLAEELRRIEEAKAIASSADHASNVFFLLPHPKLPHLPTRLTGQLCDGLARHTFLVH